jgi:8-oxo-dGTP diphosphatase
MAIQLFNVGVKAAIVNDGRLLVVKHATKGFWDVPGGRIDDNESIDQSLRREIAEELPNATLVGTGEIICAYRVPDVVLDNGGGLLLLVYRANVTFDDNTDIALSSEHSEVKWMTLGEAAEVGSHIVQQTVAALQA